MEFAKNLEKKVKLYKIRGPSIDNVQDKY